MPKLARPPAHRSPLELTALQVLDGTFDRTDLLDTDIEPPPVLVRDEELQEATFEDFAELLEAALRWDPHQHPRWPKGTAKAGQFMEVGQRFAHGGHVYELAHLGAPGSGRVYANNADLSTKLAGTKEFQVKQVGGEPTIPEAQDAPPLPTMQHGKGTNLKVPVVDPYVHPESHDPSIPIPPGSKISPEEWKRFGKVDQDNYSQLMVKFGPHKTGQAQSMINTAMSEFDSQTQSAVSSAYSSQYGSSSGFTLSLLSFFHGVTDKVGLTNATARREKVRRLQTEVAAAIQWDLYNRTHSPDMAIFHRDSGNQPSWWQQHFIDGDAPIMTGLSQSWKYGHGHNAGWGNTILMTPLAIRHVVMSTYSGGPGGVSYQNEQEISHADGLALDHHSVVLNENQQMNANQQKWLASMAGQKPVGGHVIEQLRDAIAKGEILPMPPAPPNIKMAGEGGKAWIDPPANAGTHITKDAKGNPLPKPLSVDELPHFEKDDAGQPIAQPANQLRLKEGDFIEGMQGTRYIIVDDPNDPSGFNFRYVKLVNGLPNGESYNFEGGGVKTFKKLDGHVDIPKPVTAGLPQFDPGAYVNGVDAVFVSKMKAGDKFKVSDHAYEIVTGVPSVNGDMQIKSLETAKVGTINGDYKTVLLLPKEGYVAPVPGLPSKPEVGMTFAYEGKKYQITKFLKNGMVQAKRYHATGVIKLESGDLALNPENLHDPNAWSIGESTKLSDMVVGQRFHGGTGKLHQKPYVVTGKEGKKVQWRNLDTGEEGEAPAGKKYALLSPAVPESQANVPGAHAEPKADGHIPENWTASDTTTKFADIPIGAKFIYSTPGAENIHIEKTGESEMTPLTGQYAGSPSSIDSLNAGALDQLGLKVLVPKQQLSKAVTAFSQGSYMQGETMKVKDMPEGTVFTSVTGTPYMLKSKSAKSGAVATNLLSGKPYPAIGYEKEFPTLAPKATGEVPYDDLISGDLVKLGHLDTGDQFKSDEGLLYEVVVPPKALDHTGFATVREVGTDAYGPEHALGTYYDMPVIFSAKAGHGYDPAKPKPPAVHLSYVSDFAPYASSHGSGGKVKHHKIEEMGVGSVFQDKNGKLWMRKQDLPDDGGDLTPVITDGMNDYFVAGELRGKADGLDQKEVLAFSHSVLDAPGITPVDDAEWSQELKANYSSTFGPIATLADVPEGGFFADNAGQVWKVVESGVMYVAAQTKSGQAQDFNIEYEPFYVQQDVVPGSGTVGGTSTFKLQLLSSMPDGALFKKNGSVWKKLGTTEGGELNGYTTAENQAPGGVVAHFKPHITAEPADAFTAAMHEDAPVEIKPMMKPSELAHIKSILVPIPDGWATKPSLGDMPNSTYFTDLSGTLYQKIGKAMKGDKVGVTAQNVETGQTKFLLSSYPPPMMTNFGPGDLQDDDLIGLPTLDSPSKATTEGGWVYAGPKTVGDLAVGDVYSAKPEASKVALFRVDEMTSQGYGPNKTWGLKVTPVWSNFDLPEVPKDISLQNDLDVHLFKPPLGYEVSDIVSPEGDIITPQVGDPVILGGTPPGTFVGGGAAGGPVWKVIAHFPNGTTRVELVSHENGPGLHEVGDVTDLHSDISLVVVPAPSLASQVQIAKIVPIYAGDTVTPESIKPGMQIHIPATNKTFRVDSVTRSSDVAPSGKHWVNIGWVNLTDGDTAALVIPVDPGQPTGGWFLAKDFTAADYAGATQGLAPLEVGDPVTANEVPVGTYLKTWDAGSATWKKVGQDGGDVTLEIVVPTGSENAFPVGHHHPVNGDTQFQIAPTPEPTEVPVPDSFVSTVHGTFHEGDRVEVHVPNPIAGQPDQIEYGVIQHLGEASVVKYGGSLHQVPNTWLRMVSATTSPPTIQGFASDWGSGGKYKHHPVNALAEGDEFYGKGSKALWRVVSKQADGVLVLQPDTGIHEKVDKALKVKKA